MRRASGVSSTAGAAFSGAHGAFARARSAG
jgi:hypothetical protein